MRGVGNGVRRFRHPRYGSWARGSHGRSSDTIWSMRLTTMSVAPRRFSSGTAQQLSALYGHLHAEGILAVQGCDGGLSHAGDEADHTLECLSIDVEQPSLGSWRRSPRSAAGQSLR